MTSNDDQLTEIYSSNNKADVTAKKGLLESNGIACSIKKETDERFGSAWGMPIGMEDSLRRFRLFVAPENAGHAEEILTTVPAAGQALPHIVLLDREHHVAVWEPAPAGRTAGGAPSGSQASGRPAFPREAIDEAADHRIFDFVGEYADEEGDIYQFFISERDASSIKLKNGYSWMPLHRVMAFRTAYCEVMLKGYSPPAETFGAFGFGSTPKQADSLGKLVREGTKRATARPDWCYLAEDKPRPRPGDVWVVLDGRGKPMAVIETTEVEVVPFGEVTEDFAAAEGEGDGSLEYWRKVHWKTFRKECRKLGKEPSESMPVVCERFKLVEVL